MDLALGLFFDAVANVSKNILWQEGRLSKLLLHVRVALNNKVDRSRYGVVTTLHEALNEGLVGIMERIIKVDRGRIVSVRGCPSWDYPANESCFGVYG